MPLFKKQKKEFRQVEPVVMPDAEPVQEEEVPEYENPQQMYEPQVRAPAPKPLKPKVEYVEVPVDIGNEDNQRLWLWENNRMLKRLMKYIEGE